MEAETPAAESDEAEASFVAPGRIRPRKTVFQRLSQANRPCRWKVGDRVLVRDRNEKEHSPDITRPSEDDWNPGIVTSLHPVKVRLKGGKEPFTWREIKEMPPRMVRSASPSPTSTSLTWSRSKFLPASAEVLRRARRLSKRRRNREKEAERKDVELYARAQRIQSAKLRNAAASVPNAAEQKKQEQVRKLRRALEELLPGLDELEAERKPQARVLRTPSPGRVKASQPLGPSVSSQKVLAFSRGLQGFGFEVKHLGLLTVQDRKDVLKKLSHPSPEQAVKEDVMFAWIKEQLQNYRMHCSAGQLPQAASSSTTAMSILKVLRACIERSAPNEDDIHSLQRFATALTDANLQLDHLDRLPQPELARLVEKLGSKMTTGMKKEEVIQKLKNELWSLRTRSSQGRSTAELCRYEPAEAIVAVRRLLKKAEEERESEAKPMAVWELHLWLGQYNASVKDLGCLLPSELRQLTSWLKMPPLRSKEDILEWLQREVWREQMVRRAPSKSSRFLKLSSKTGRFAPGTPFKYHEAKMGWEYDYESEDESELLVDLNSEVTMEYDMFVPT